MDLIEVKDFLSRAHRLREYIAVKEEQLSDLRKTLNVNAYDTNSQWLVCKIVDLEKEITSEIGLMIDSIREIKKAIESIDDITLRLLLEMHYLNYKNFDVIADELHYSDRHVYRLHDEALKLIQANIKAA